MPKIAFVGNLCNCTYWYVKHLREVGIDAWLYIVFKKYDREGNPIITFQEDPREKDRELSGKLPFWVKFFHLYSIKSLLNLKKEFGQYDLNIAFKSMPIFLQFCPTPLISFGTGTNLRKEVFRKGIRPFLLRRGFLKSKMVLFDNVDMGTLKALKKLKIRKYEWIPDYFSRDNLLEAIENSEIKDDFLSKFKERLICFSPSRINFYQKGTDILIKGFANFIKENSSLARLLIIDWGKDRKKLKKLIKDLEIERQVAFLPVLSYPDVLNLIKNCSLVFGYFRDGNSGIHHFPLVIEETLALGNILVSTIDRNAFHEIVGEEPSILKAFSSSDIKTQLEFVLGNYNSIKKDFSLRGPAWINKYHSKNFITNKLIKIVNRYT